ncbi:spermatogenesis-associated protein 5-like protein 1 isoform X2 [Dermacentor silvarum]|uniref:spermatogenesis-associated protein 5-like protein 1 isoform X2 n=1 Tax=Dermacentor silvarum TaxID=543639 RepID=UPI0021015D83|nr:spermatogenesis-associated protein 5-like protein 1 isoform X2 [Dermacentor silvarum]
MLRPRAPLFAFLSIAIVRCISTVYSATFRLADQPSLEQQAAIALLLALSTDTLTDLECVSAHLHDATCVCIDVDAHFPAVVSSARLVFRAPTTSTTASSIKEHLNDFPGNFTFSGHSSSTFGMARNSCFCPVQLLIGALSTQERTDIMRTVGSQLGFDLSHLVLPTAGFVLGDMMTLLRESLMAAIKRTPSSDNEALITSEDFQAALTTVQSNLNSRLEFAVEVVPRFSWKQLGGIECIRKKLQTALEGPLLNPAAFGRLGVSQPRGVLLVGPHGCGKTAIALAAASSCPGFTLFSLGAADVYSPFVGDSEKVVSAVFRQARLRAPSAIFMDDLDTLVGHRSGEHSGAQERILSALLCEIDGIGTGVLQNTGRVQEQLNVVLVATTCNPDAVDEALLRPGRFDLIVYVPPPDAQAREQILKVCTAKMSLGDVNLMSLAKRTEYFTAADVVHLCHMAGLQAMRELGFNAPCVEQRHFEEALSSTFPSLCPQKVEELRQRCAKFCLVT